jgi:AraC-like DNA-binding protein
METLDLTAMPGYHMLFKLETRWRRRSRFSSRLRLTPKELAVALERVDELDQELRTREPGFGFLATASFMRLVGYLSRSFEHARHADSRALLRIGQSINYIESHLGEPVHLDVLADIAQMSKRSFIRSFQAALGSSPISYLIRLRINRAAELLRRGEGSITDIAFSSGFSDSNYFSRQFRAAFGVSPRGYRRGHPRMT